MAETPMQGLAEYLRSGEAALMRLVNNPLFGNAPPDEADTAEHIAKLRRWASEVEAARASPADTRSERERFEAWAHSMCMSVEREPFPTRQAYLSLATSNAWEGWKGCRASLPAPTDAEERREWERIAVERAADYGAALYVKVAQVTPEERVRLARAALLAHLRARPAEPTPSVDVLRQEEALRQCLEALRAAEGFTPSTSMARELGDAAIDAARQALEKP